MSEGGATPTTWSCSPYYDPKTEFSLFYFKLRNFLQKWQLSHLHMIENFIMVQSRSGLNIDGLGRLMLDILWCDIYEEDNKEGPSERTHLLFLGFFFFF